MDLNLGGKWGSGCGRVAGYALLPRPFTAWILQGKPPATFTTLCGFSGPRQLQGDLGEERKQESLSGPAPPILFSNRDGAWPPGFQGPHCPTRSQHS